jgi:hypothetical protein
LQAVGLQPKKENYGKNKCKRHSRMTIKLLGFWETLYNPNFKHIEFDVFRNQAGLNAFVLSPKQWIEKTNAIGLVAKSGRYGGTFAHRVMKKQQHFYW